jgi:hypothetical protein
MKHSPPLQCRRSFNQLVLLFCLCLVALTVMPDAAETASRKKDYAPAKARRKTAPAPVTVYPSSCRQPGSEVMKQAPPGSAQP